MLNIKPQICRLSKRTFFLRTIHRVAVNCLKVWILRNFFLLQNNLGKEGEWIGSKDEINWSHVDTMLMLGMVHWGSLYYSFNFFYSGTNDSKTFLCMNKYSKILRILAVRLLTGRSLELGGTEVVLEAPILLTLINMCACVYIYICIVHEEWLIPELKQGKYMLHLEHLMEDSMECSKI